MIRLLPSSDTLVLGGMGFVSDARLGGSSARSAWAALSRLAIQLQHTGLAADLTWAFYVVSVGLQAKAISFLSEAAVGFSAYRRWLAHANGCAAVWR